MIDKAKLEPVLDGYKTYFPKHWKNEKYKWKAIQHFQAHWDIEAENFGDMFKAATDKTFNLLASGYAYPRGMITNFAKADGEHTREMFRNLYDESQDLAARVAAFQQAAKEMREKYNDGTWKNHYQNTNAISTYLWLRYPDKYYIFKYEIFRATAKELEADYAPKRDGSANTMLGGFHMYDEICEMVQADEEIRMMIQAALTDSCYSDPEMKTATIDIGFYLARYYLDEKKSNREKNVWYPQEYSPGLTADDWAALLQDTSVFTENALKIMKRMKDYGGQATCTQLAAKYGNVVNFYNSGSVALARRIVDKTGCPVMDAGKEYSKMWPVLYQGTRAGKEEDGVYIWRLRPELNEALEQADLRDIPLYEESMIDLIDDSVRYWLYAPGMNAGMWDFFYRESIMALGWEEVGDLKTFSSKNEVRQKLQDEFSNESTHKNDAHALWQFAYEMKPGDIVIVKKGRSEILGKGVVDGEYEYDPDFDEEFPHIRKVRWTQKGNWQSADMLAMKTLTDLTNYTHALEKLLALFAADTDLRDGDKAEVLCQPYTKVDFLKTVFMTAERYDVLAALLRNKKNVILQGAPGVGKTFTAKKLAYAMMGVIDDARIEMVQFHQNYSYEDFIMGYRPAGADFKLTEGIFYQFCMTASNHPEQEYFFIIDEINRGNLSKIFGELLMMIEKDYRGTKVKLAYDGRSFSVPENLYIIGMMNTADRSLAMIDYALRRRFSFFEMEPGFNSDGFTEYQKALADETFDELIGQIRILNKEIAEDNALGRGFQIGHSYFCGREEEGCTDEWMRSVVEFDILPMLGEYWFDEPAKLQRWERNLRGVFDD